MGADVSAPLHMSHSNAGARPGSLAMACKLGVYRPTTTANTRRDATGAVVTRHSHPHHPPPPPPTRPIDIMQLLLSKRVCATSATSSTSSSSVADTTLNDTTSTTSNPGSLCSSESSCGPAYTSDDSAEGDSATVAEADDGEGGGGGETAGGGGEDMVAIGSDADGQAQDDISLMLNYVNQGFMDWDHTIYYSFKKGLEKKYHPRDSLQSQPQVTPESRGLLIDWMIKVQRKLKMSRETMFLAVNAVDRFLITTPISKDCLTLLGLTALWVASKVEEIGVPSVDMLLSLCWERYTSGQVQHMEVLVLVRLGFALHSATPLFFLEHYCATRIQVAHIIGCTVQDIRRSRALAMYLLELIIQDYMLSQRAPSLLALCCLEVADGYFHKETSLKPLDLQEHSSREVFETALKIDKLLKLACKKCNIGGLLDEYMPWVQDEPELVGSPRKKAKYDNGVANRA